MDIEIPGRCDFRVGDVINSRDCSYRVERELGEGTFGIVYKVTDNRGNTRALKLLKLWTVTPDVYKGMKDRFLIEYKTGLIQSDFLVHSYDFGDVNNNPFFVMEFCPYGDLRDFASKNRVDFSAVGADILCGLRDLHNEGKVHRDLKPENVLLKENNRAVLTDFGIAGDQNKRMTERGIAGKPKQIFGTYPYMPPEQVNPPRGGKATVLPTTDIFSFGVMMYEMMVGQLPFGELVRDEQLYQYLENGKRGNWDRNALRRVDGTGAWSAIMERCLDPNYKTRISSATEVMQMLPQSFGMRPPVQEQVYRSFMNVREGLLLRVMQGLEFGKVYKLNDFISENHNLITMGRREMNFYNDISIPDDECFISRTHCTLEYDRWSNQWWIRDGQWRLRCPISQSLPKGCIGCTAYCPSTYEKQGEWKHSLNGTYVNSSEVTDMGIPLKPGDIITIGDVKLRLEGY